MVVRGEGSYRARWMNVLDLPQVSKKRDRVTGVRTVKYSVTSTVEMTIGGAPLNFVSVELVCDYNVTPFCDNPS